MVAIPERKKNTVAKIFQRYEWDDEDWRRPHLGASIVGHFCNRYLWYSFRWAQKTVTEGRMLRLFERGHREEEWLAQDLRNVGIEILTYDPETGEQFRFTSLGGHFAGSTDGIANGFVEAPKAMHVFECKTSNAKWWKTLTKKGVESAQPKHYVQMQVYMHYFKSLGMRTDRAFYFSVNKDTDEIYGERIRYNRSEAELANHRAETVVFAPEPLTKVSDNPTWHACKQCPYRPICHLEEVEKLERNCRTCASSTPQPDGTWTCDFYQKKLTVEEQRAGCEKHLFIPKLLPWEAVAFNDHGRCVTYKDRKGVLIGDSDKSLSVLATE